MDLKSTLYIGLVTRNGLSVNAAAPVEIVAKHFSAFTYFGALGFWEGQKEPNLIVSIVHNAAALVDVNNLARVLAVQFDQTAVLVETVQIASNLVFNPTIEGVKARA